MNISAGLIIELDNAQWLRGVDDLRPWDELIRHRAHLDLGRSSLRDICGFASDIDLVILSCVERESDEVVVSALEDDRILDL